MTGAGTTQVAWTREPDYGDSPTDPTYVYPGRNVQVTDISLQNALERSRLPDDNEAAEAIAQRFSGALSLEYDLTHPWMLTDVFVSESEEDVDGVHSWSMGRGQMPSSRWYIGVDVGSAEAERELKGAVTPQLQLQITEGQNVRVTQTLVYGDEEKHSSLTPGDVVGGDESPYVYHGADLTIDASTYKKLQQGTLEITNNGALDYGWERKAIDAVAGNADYSLSVSKIVTDTVSDNVALAYGNNTAPVSTAGIDGVNGDLPITRGDGDQIAFSLEGIRPDTYGWDNIPPTGEDRVQEAIQMFVDRVTASADVTMSDPFASA